MDGPRGAATRSHSGLPGVEDRLTMTNETIQLRDGRTLGYARWGPATGAVLFYFHGHPGCRLEDIAVPNAWLWHGELDQEVPIAAARGLASRWPGCRASYLPEGHISLIVNHADAIVAALAGA